jgi:hypothetical protein
MPGWTGGGGETATSDPESWPYAVERREDVWIELPLEHGAVGPALRLSASLWLPQTRKQPAPQARAAEDLVVPAVLEYLPYRWGDATYYRDFCRHPCAFTRSVPLLSAHSSTIRSCGISAICLLTRVW